MKHAKTGLCLLLVLIITLAPIPLLAAEGFSFENEAKVLEQLGLYKGPNTTKFVPDLGTSLNRETGVVMFLRTFGLENDALATTEAEANATLRKFSDAAEISYWAKKQVAYAVKKGLVSGLPEGTFAPKANMVGKAYCTLILRQLGFTPNYDQAPNELVDAGGLTATQARDFSHKPLKKDDLVGISYGALSAIDKNGKSVISNLIENNVVDVRTVMDSGLTIMDAVRVAAEAVSFYEKAPIETLDNIKAAEVLGIRANDMVALVTDADIKTRLEARIKMQKEKIDIAKKNLQEPAFSTATFTLTVESKPYQLSSGSSTHHHSIPSMSGTVVITGTAKYGSILTADPALLINAGTPMYQWNRNGAAIGGATTSTYTLAAADIGAVITVTATADGVTGIGSITSTPTAIIAKADGPAAPEPPTEAGKTANSITLTANALHQFSKDGGTTWQDSEVFTGLLTYYPYTFVARIKETSTTNASAASGGTSIITAAPDIVITAVAATCSCPSIGDPGANAAVAAAEYVHVSTVWSGRAGETYAAGETPAAVITLATKAGYTLAGLSASDITVGGGTVTYGAGQGVQGGGTSVVFTVTYGVL